MDGPDEPPPPFINFLPKTPSTTSIYEMPREPRLNLLIAANGHKEISHAQAIAVRLSKEPKIAIKVIVDDLTHRLAQEFPAYVNKSITPPAGRAAAGAPAARDAELLERRAFELVAWADLLVLAPIDADHLARMMAGMTDTLLLEVLRSWDASKRILLVPGMSTHMWENPVTKRQISKLHRKWHWVRVLPPILWHYYESASVTAGASGMGSSTGTTTPVAAGGVVPATALTMTMTATATKTATATATTAATTTTTTTTPVSSVISSSSKKRVIEWSGFADLIGIIKNQADLLSLGRDVDVAAALSGRPFAAGGGGMFLSKRSTTRLPPEIWTMILDATGDWELAQALDVFTNLPMPMIAGWSRTPRDPSDPLQVFMHELEWTLLTADTDHICQKLSEAPANLHDLSALAIKLIFKFSLTAVLSYIEAHCPIVFRTFDGKTVPTKASAYFGKTAILDWWVRSPSFLEKQYDAEALDGASKNGYVHVLEWWRRSGLPLRYTEAALEQASAKGHVRVLEWWREASLTAAGGGGGSESGSGSGAGAGSSSGLAAAAAPAVVLKPGRALICAAQYGRVAVIRWWEESGINAGHQDAICKVASRWGQVGVLELWRELRGDDKITFNSQVLVEPTVHAHITVLDWWKQYAHGQLPGMNGRRAKQVEYRTMDIEEALEDALGDPAAVRRWWAENGLNLGLGTSEWMKARYL